MGISLVVKVGSLELNSPLILASGTCSHETLPFLNPDEIGAIVLKTVTLKPRQGNRPPRLAETPAGLLNSIGLQNPGVDEFLAKEVKQFPLDYKLVGSVGGETVEEYVEVARKLESSGRFIALELNVSCPNVKKGGIEFGRDEKALSKLLRKIRETVSIPLWVKLTPNASRVEEVAKAAYQEGADALVVTNTFIGMAIDVETRSSRLSTLTGGLSGPAIKPLALYLVYKVAKSVNIPVIGGGGIFDYRDALEFLIAGASAFSIGTAMLINPAAAKEIIQGLKNWLNEHQIKKITELIGTFKEPV